MRIIKKIILLVIVFLLSTISNVYADESSKKAEVTLTMQILLISLVALVIVAVGVVIIKKTVLK